MYMDSLDRTSNGWLHSVIETADRVRARVLDYTLKNNGGYLSQACSSAELLSTLYLKVMKLGPSTAPLVPLPFPGPPGPDNPAYFTGAAYNGTRLPELDRFYFSPVHYALVLYSVLIETGRMAPEGLAHFNRDGSSVELIGAEHSPGHEVTAGSLAQCLSQAAGVALARRLKGETGRNIVFTSDGEYQEGQTWETVASMVWYKLDNMLVYIDANAQQCDGEIDSVMGVEPLVSRLEAFGARVCEVDGHSPEALAAPGDLTGAGRPVFVVARTNPCQGIPLLENRIPKLHYVRFKSEAERMAYQRVLDELRARSGLSPLVFADKEGSRA